jgi:hypothetical protein
MKRLEIIAGEKISQKQWQKLKSQMNLGRTQQIDKARFQNKKKQSLQYENLLREIKNPHLRFYSKAKILNMIDSIYQTGFYYSTTPLPNISYEYIVEFIKSLKNENPNQLYTIYTFQKNHHYQIYVFKTPNRVTQHHYPRNTILKVIIHDNQIIDLQELCSTEQYQKTSQLFKKNQNKN